MTKHDNEGIMKATEFVKKHGWDAVIEAVKTTPLDHDFQSTDLEPKLAKDGSIIGFDCKVHTISHAAVKRLVESHELVNHMGGLEKAMDVVINQEANGRNMTQLAQAIADVEACQ